MLALLQIAGLVFLDQNANQRPDPGEAGVANVVVSNQHQVTSTGTSGRFELPTAGTGVVFVSLPNGYRSSGPFWRRAADGRPSFGLIKTPEPTAFSFIHGSDPHVQPSSVGRLERVRTIVDSTKADFILISGDLVRDALRVGEAEATGYFDLYTKTIATFPTAVWSAPGNHELFGIERHHSLVSAMHPLYGRGMYRHHLGPDYYSFNYGGVHFIALNTVDNEDLWYLGRIDSTQMAWLAADLAALPATTPVITFGHIPFLTSSEAMKGFEDGGVAPSTIRVGGKTQYRHTVSNVRQALALLWRRPYPVALQGHTHLREVIRYGITDSTTRFETAAAIVSGWEDGPIRAISSVTLYRVTNGRVAEGVTIPIDPPRR